MSKEITVEEGNTDPIEQELCRAFMQDLIAEEKEVHRKNERLLRAIKSVKGEVFYEDLLYEIKEAEGINGLAELVKYPVGIYQTADGKKIKNIWVNQTTNGGYSGDSFAGSVCIRIKKGKYLKFYYSM